MLLPTAMRLPADDVQLGRLVPRKPPLGDSRPLLARFEREDFERGDHQPDGTVTPKPGSFGWLLEQVKKMMVDLGTVLDARGPAPEVIVASPYMRDMLRNALLDAARLSATPPIVVDTSKIDADWLARHAGLDKPKTATEIGMKMQASLQRERELRRSFVDRWGRTIEQRRVQAREESVRQLARIGIAQDAPMRADEQPPVSVFCGCPMCQPRAIVGVDPAVPGSDATVMAEVTVDAGQLQPGKIWQMQPAQPVQLSQRSDPRTWPGG